MGIKSGERLGQDFHPLIQSNVEQIFPKINHEQKWYNEPVLLLAEKSSFQPRFGKEAYSFNMSKVDNSTCSAFSI